MKLNVLTRNPITMSVPVFMKLERKELTLKEIMATNTSETFVSKIMENSRVKKAAVVFMATMLYSQKALAAGKGIDALGITLITLIRQWAYWILIIMCIIEIIRAGAGGDSKKILGIVMKYLLIFASMYLVPTLFDAVKNSF
jgi:hypothetical protein